VIAQSRLLEEFEGFSIWEIGEDRAIETTQFVFEIYLALFSRKYQWSGEYEKMSADDRATLPYSTLFAALSREGSILATIRLIEKKNDPLPIEKDFGLDLVRVSLEKGVIPNRIFEIGRLAKNPLRIRQSGIPARNRLALVDELIAQSVYESSQESGNVWAASIDIEVLGLLRERGFQFEPVGETDTAYLGSPTTPVFLPVDRCRDAMRDENPERFLKYFRPIGVPISILP